MTRDTQIDIIDNTEVRLIDALATPVATARHVRFAVAFARLSGYRLLEQAVRTCLSRGGEVEFLLGLDFRTTEPAVLNRILDLREQFNRVSLYCYSSPDANSKRSFHPKLYLMQRPPTAVAVVGSSNFTGGGMADNVEANVLVQASEDAPLIERAVAIYNRMKLQPTSFAPDRDYVASYELAYRRLRDAERSARGTLGVRDCVAAVRRRERALPRPIARVTDFVGWQRLVFERLPDGEFGTGDLYAYAEEFRQHYPANRNVRPKIRQVLQQLRDLGVIEHSGKGRWRRLPAAAIESGTR